MFVGNKYFPFKRERKIYDCWKMTDGEYENTLNNYNGVHSWSSLNSVKSRYKTNVYGYGAYQKNNGAWKSNHTNDFKVHKKVSNKNHRKAEKEAIEEYLSNGDFLDCVGQIKILGKYDCFW